MLYFTEVRGVGVGWGRLVGGWGSLVGRWGRLGAIVEWGNMVGIEWCMGWSESE